jgi:NAD(P)-dependent dehydrogenase (short-subunit alcohol dehydrogenase family)
VVGVNLTGFFTLTQRAIAEMLKRGSGHVVNITTTLADYANSSTPSVLTSLTKGGLASATKSLAIEDASAASGWFPPLVRSQLVDLDLDLG